MDSTLSDDAFSQAKGDGSKTLDAAAQGHDAEDDAAEDASGDDAAKDESNAGSEAPQVPAKVPVPAPFARAFPASSRSPQCAHLLCARRRGASRDVCG
jgi:hypothetical protein